MEIRGERRSPAPFAVVVENKIGGAASRQNDFESAKGDRIIADLLIQAGLAEGTWRFRVREPFRASNHTPRIQVRGVTEWGVALNVKPGGNGSAVKGVLVVDRDKGISAKEVYDKLKAIAEAEQEAVSPHGVIDFIGSLSDREMAKSEDLIEADRLASAPSLLDPPKVPDPVLNKDKLQKLATLPDRLAKVRADIKQAEDRVLKAEGQLEELRAQEKKLMAIDVKALAALLESLE